MEWRVLPSASELALGYIRGEGAGAMLIKSSADAEEGRCQQVAEALYVPSYTCLLPAETFAAPTAGCCRGTWTADAAAWIVTAHSRNYLR